MLWQRFSLCFEVEQRVGQRFSQCRDTQKLKAAYTSSLRPHTLVAQGLITSSLTAYATPGAEVYSVP